MAKDMFWTTVTFGIIIGALVLAFWPSDKNLVTVKYDCRHTDLPIKAQEACKKRNEK